MAQSASITEETCAALVILACYLNQKQQGMKANDIRLTLNVTLDELYDECTKCVTYRAFNRFVRPVKKRVRVHLVGNSEEYRFEGQGDESPFTNMSPGDLIINVQRIPHPHFEVCEMLSRHDLYTVPLEVSLYDFYYGRNILLQLPGKGRPLEFKYNEQRHANGTVFHGKGLPMPGGTRGDLYVYFNIVLPSIPRKLLDNFLARLFMRRLFVKCLENQTTGTK